MYIVEKNYLKWQYNYSVTENSVVPQFPIFSLVTKFFSGVSLVYFFTNKTSQLFMYSKYLGTQKIFILTIQKRDLYEKYS